MKSLTLWMRSGDTTEVLQKCSVFLYCGRFLRLAGPDINVCGSSWLRSPELSQHGVISCQVQNMTSRSSWWANQPSTSLLHLTRGQSGPQSGVRARCRYLGDPAESKRSSIKSLPEDRSKHLLLMRCLVVRRRVQSRFSVTGALSLTVLSPQHQWRPCPTFPVRPWRQTPIPPSHPEQRWMGTFSGTGSGAPNMLLLDPGQFYKWSQPTRLQWAGTHSSPGSSHVMATLAFQIKFLSSSTVLRFGSLLCKRTDFHLIFIILARMDICVDCKTTFSAKRGHLQHSDSVPAVTNVKRLILLVSEETSHSPRNQWQPEMGDGV